MELTLGEGIFALSEARGGNLGMTADDDDDGDGPDNGLAQFALARSGKGDPHSPYFKPKSFSLLPRLVFPIYNLPKYFLLSILSSIGPFFGLV